LAVPQAYLPSLADAVRTRRRQRRWRQEDVARTLQVTQQTVARWEAGDVPQRRLHRPLADFLGIDLDAFYELLETEPRRLNLVALRDPSAPATEHSDDLTAAQQSLLDAVIKRIDAGVPIGAEEMQFFRGLGVAVGLAI
jgi:transcriptional regulator with XRE-family HTH domain